jgi:hypothetical protein
MSSAPLFRIVFKKRNQFIAIAIREWNALPVKGDTVTLDKSNYLVESRSFEDSEVSDQESPQHTIIIYVTAL